MKIRPVEAKLFHVDGETDMAKPIVAFRNFANAPKHNICFYNSDIAFHNKKISVLTELLYNVLLHLFPLCFCLSCLYPCICLSPSAAKLVCQQSKTNVNELSIRLEQIVCLNHF
jgi:hypothetical protein